MRLDKFLANLKLGSRKDVKKIIKSGLIKVNNELIKKDDYKLKPSDIVCYNNQVLEYKEFVYYLGSYAILLIVGIICSTPLLGNLYNRLKGQCSLWCPLSDKDFHFKRSKDNVLFL